MKRYCGRVRDAAFAVVLLALAAISGCAGTPRTPPQCEGPWVPINAQDEIHDRS